MKNSFRRMSAVLLTVLTLLTAFTAFGAFAAETEKTEPAAAETAVQETTAEETTVPETVPETTAEPGAEPVGAQPEVGRVTGLGKNTTNVNNINLVWNKTENADGYVIYRCSADYDKGAFRQIADVSTNTYNDTKLVQGSPYHYKIAAYEIRDGKKVYGEFTLYKTATQPAKVTGISRLHSSNYCDVGWNRNPKATGYKIFRSCAESNNQFVLYKTIESGSVTHFADYNVKEGGIYTYKVVAFRVLYNRNWYHAPGSSLHFMSGLCAPNFNTQTALFKVSLSWYKNRYATRYDIYCSKDKNASAYTFLGSTTGASFTPTARWANGEKLYFRVYPIYKNNGVTVTGTAHTKLVTVSDMMYGTHVSNTYIEIDIAKQRMWFYKKGSLVVETPIVTGNKGSADTPKGYYEIESRATDTNLVGDDYVSHVDYWLGFYGGYGIHDASWRSSFGGSIYTYDGSHGCVNTPYSAVKTIYNNTSYGTPVVIY